MAHPNPVDFPAHDLYPHAQPPHQPGMYPPPPPSAPEEEGYQRYQGYSGGWSEQQAAPLSSGADADAGAGRPFHYHYQDDADCITFLRGCLAGLCCCVLLEQCCCL